MSEQQAGTIDYAKVPGHRLPGLCGDDASLWAAAFCQTAKRLGHDIDEGWMIGWFANAIEASWEKRVKRAEPDTQPIAPDNCIHGAALTMYCPLCASRGQGSSK